MDYLTPDLDVPQLWDYGAKALAFDWTLLEWPAAPILPYVKARHDDSPEKIRDMTAEKLGKDGNFIVRSSSPYELRMGSAGLWRSYKDFGSCHIDIGYVSGIVKGIRFSLPESVEEFLHSIGREVDDNIVPIMVQPLSESSLSGTVVRHPNRPELMIVEAVKVADVKSPFLARQGKNMYSVYVHDDGSVIEGTEKAGKDYDHPALPAGASLFKRMESLGYISQDYAYQIEFGHDPDFVYQIRPFKKKERACFRLELDGEKYVIGTLAFGISPQEGIELPVVRIPSVRTAISTLKHFDSRTEHDLIEEIEMAKADSDSYNQDGFVETYLHSYLARMDEMIPQGYCLVMDKYRAEGNMDMHIGNAKALLIEDRQSFALSHDMVRTLQKVPVVGFGLQGIDDILKTGDIVKVYSDGTVCAAERIGES